MPFFVSGRAGTSHFRQPHITTVSDSNPAPHLPQPDRGSTTRLQAPVLPPIFETMPNISSSGFADPPTPQRQFALSVVTRLRDAGFHALWAGGCVRDALLGKTPKDYDVASSATPEQVIQLFSPARTVAVGASFGVVMVLGSDKQAGQVEVATFRSDGQYLDGRRPHSVRFCDAEEDALRRDFTINGMFYDPVERQLIDYVGGQKDLEAGIIRAIGDPLARFTEDKLRMLRAIRFAATFHFELDPKTKHCIQQLQAQVNQVSVERISQELKRMFSHPLRANALRLLNDTGLLQAIFPVINWTAKSGIQSSVANFHDDSNNSNPHNIQGSEKALDHANHPNTSDINADSRLSKAISVFEKLEDASFESAFAILFADLLKPGQNARHRREAIHDECRRFKFSNEESQTIEWLIDSSDQLKNSSSLQGHQLKPILADVRVHRLLQLMSAMARGTGRSTEDADFCLQFHLSIDHEGAGHPPLSGARGVDLPGVVCLCSRAGVGGDFCHYR